MDQRFGPPTCPVCWGKECRGGGNKRCVQRDPKPSHIAAIVDTYGGVRTIVGHKAKFRHHVRPDEVLVVVPKPLVHTPIAWGDIPNVIALGKHYVDLWAQTRPNESHAIEAQKMYRLRCLEQKGGSLNLYDIVET